VINHPTPQGGRCLGCDQCLLPEARQLRERITELQTQEVRLLTQRRQLQRELENLLHEVQREGINLFQELRVECNHPGRLSARLLNRARNRQTQLEWFCPTCQATVSTANVRAGRRRLRGWHRSREGGEPSPGETGSPDTSPDASRRESGVGVRGGGPAASGGGLGPKGGRHSPSPLRGPSGERP